MPGSFSEEVVKILAWIACKAVFGCMNDVHHFSGRYVVKVELFLLGGFGQLGMKILHGFPQEHARDAGQCAVGVQFDELPGRALPDLWT